MQGEAANSGDQTAALLLPKYLHFESQKKKGWFAHAGEILES